LQFAKIPVSGLVGDHDLVVDRIERKFPAGAGNFRKRTGWSCC
jgi:hypothetical protein